MTDSTDARLQATARELPTDAAEIAPETDELPGESAEVWIAPQAGRPMLESREVWIGPKAGALVSVRSFRVRRMLGSGWRAEHGAEAFVDARIDARYDARARQLASAPARKFRCLGTELQILHGYADAFHPHGEALGPGAQRRCTEREKHAFGGAHPHDFPGYMEESDSRFSGQHLNSGSRDAC